MEAVNDNLAFRHTKISAIFGHEKRTDQNSTQFLRNDPSVVEYAIKVFEIGGATPLGDPKTFANR